MKPSLVEDQNTHEICPHAVEWAKEVFADDAAYLLNQAAHLAREAVASRLEPLGVSPRQAAVMQLLASREPLRQQELGALLGIDRTSMVALIDGLEKIDYVNREPDPADRRAYALRLTEHGKGANAAIAAAMAEAQAAILAPLTGDECETAKAILRKLAGGKS